MSYLLDTDICIALLKRKEAEVVRQFNSRRAEGFFLCSIVKAELLFGARNSSKTEFNLKAFSDFFSQFQSLSFDDLAAEHYGVLRATLQKSGNPIGANDLFIASIALANDMTILTRNRNEFFRVPALRVETW